MEWLISSFNRGGLHIISSRDQKRGFSFMLCSEKERVPCNMFQLAIVIQSNKYMRVSRVLDPTQPICYLTPGSFRIGSYISIPRTPVADISWHVGLRCFFP